MSWTDYQRWIDRGRPFRLMQPAKDLRDKLRAHGYTVYDIGNESHMVHEPPEDHTPYSQTSYPGSSVYGVGYAEDIMPPAPGQRSKVDGLPLPSLAQLGAQLVADRLAGHPGIRWLKYINWEPQGPSGPCYQDSWKPNHAQRSSSDRGHIHISGLTGYESSTVGAGYDPVTRIRGGDDMSVEAERAIIELRDALLDPKKNGGYGASALQMLRDGSYSIVKGNETSTYLGKRLVAISQSLVALAEAAGVPAAKLDELRVRVEELATADAQRDADMVELLRAGQSGELTAEQVLAKLRDLLPAGAPSQG